MSSNATACSVLRGGFCDNRCRVSLKVWRENTHCFPNIGLHDNNKLTLEHFEMGIRCANFMPISNHFLRERGDVACGLFVQLRARIRNRDCT